MAWVEGAGDPLVKEIERLRLDANYWRSRYELLEREMRGILRTEPDEEPEGYWKDRYAQLQALVKAAEGQQWTSPAVREVFRAVRPQSADIDQSADSIERIRRNNVVT